MAVADVGIAMGAAGTDIGEAGDIVLMSDDLGKIGTSVSSPPDCLTIRQNIAVSLINVAFMVVAALLGYLGLVTGLLLNEASAVFVILNALRLLKWKSPADTGTPSVTGVTIPVRGKPEPVLTGTLASVLPVTGGSCCSCTVTTPVVSKIIPKTTSAVESCCSCTASLAEAPAPVVEAAKSSCCCSGEAKPTGDPLLFLGPTMRMNRGHWRLQRFGSKGLVVPVKARSLRSRLNHFTGL